MFVANPAGYCASKRGRSDFSSSTASMMPIPPVPSWGAEIRHLLHHTSGLPDYFPLFKPHGADELIVARDMLGVTNEAVLERIMDAGLEYLSGRSTAMAVRAMRCWR